MGFIVSILRQIYRILWGSYLIFRNQPTFKMKMVFLLTFARIETKRLIVKIFPFHLTRERFLKYQVSFPSYEAFSNLFFEIFALAEYAFDGPDDSLIIDCGANIGMSVMYFKRIRPNSTIIAFEPDDKAYEYLSRNIETNGLTDVHLNKTAVFDRDGEITWYSALHDTPSSLLEMSVFQSSLGEQKLKSTTVACARLSSFIDRTVNLLKIDVQGAETKVLEDLKKTGKLDLVNDMIIEFHFDSINNPLGRLISILEESGFYVSIHAFHQLKLPPYYKTRGVPYFFVIFASRIKGEKAPTK